MGTKQHINEDGVLLVPPPKSVGSKEQLQRINYLLQLSTFHALMNVQDAQNGLSRSYVKNIDTIQKKSKLSLTPAFKRAICKRCHRVQLPLKTMRPFVENKSKVGRSNPRGDVLVYECKCGNTKRFPVGRDSGFSCYAEKASNLLEVQDRCNSGRKGR